MKSASIVGAIILAILVFVGTNKIFNVDRAKDFLREWGVLISETQEAIRSVENDISILRSIKDSVSTWLWKYESQIRRNAETKTQTEEQIAAKEKSLNDLDARLKEGKPLFDRFSKKEMKAEEIDAYIAKSGVELNALRDLLGELNRQDELLGAQLAKIQQETGTVPIRLLELNKGLELLKLQYAFNQQYVADLKKNGRPLDAEAVYRRAKDQLSQTMQGLGCGDSTPMPEPDLGSAASTVDRCEQQRQKIRELLGRTNDEPMMK